MSEIGEARRLLKEIAEELRMNGDHYHADQIDDIVDHMMHRKTPARGRMPSTSNEVTPRMKEQIRELAKTTTLHNAEIAAKLGVNPGRVSEVLHEDD
jgi:hypothetical protein